MIPLVTCIMPTANRRDHMRRAIALFLAQDYAHKRLVIVEDGDEYNADTVPPLAEINYVHLGGHRRTIGEKRNIACERALNGLIAHWDDDDWHSPRRLSTQVAAMQRSGATLCGLDRLVFFDGAQAWLYRSIDSTWLAGGTLLYDRALWKSQPFEHRSNGEDTLFVRSVFVDGINKAARVTDERLYVAMIHSGNTVPKEPDRQWGKFDAVRVRRWIGDTSTAKINATTQRSAE